MSSPPAQGSSAVQARGTVEFAALQFLGASGLIGGEVPARGRTGSTITGTGRFGGYAITVGGVIALATLMIPAALFNDRP